jgi:hypothetical protein
MLFSGTTNGTSTIGGLFFNGGGESLRYIDLTTPSTFQTNVTVTPVYRDFSSWYHVILAVDTTQATAANRIRFYVNGAEVTAFSSAVYPAQNADTFINAAQQHRIGTYPYSTSGPFDGYLAEVNFIDGQALTPASFGAFSPITGVWQPARYTGTYGTNGFYLPFTDNSTAAALGTDFSGNGNTWTVNNISVTAGVTYDSMTDVPTLTSATASNFATGNPLSVGANTSLANGNLSGTLTGSGGWSATICGLTSGKWYYEATVTANSGNSMWVGFLSDVYTLNNNAWSFSTQTALYANDARNGNNASYGATWTTNDVIGIALDISTSSGSITFYKNGVSQGVMFSSLTSSAAWRPLISGGGTGTTIAMNFGQRPFAYTPPTGFVALNTFNLAASTIVKGNTNFNAVLYTGTGSAGNAITGVGFQPDFNWIKTRSTISNHLLTDSVRGTGRSLFSNLTEAESTTRYITSLDSDGFTVGTPTDDCNESGRTFVAWNWKAGGAAVTNTAGSISAQVSANPTAGFSVVTYTGNATVSTVGHGLGVAPSMIIVKGRTNAVDWQMYHVTQGISMTLALNSSAARQNIANYWGASAPTSSVFGITGSYSGVNASGVTYVAYCWSEISGFSKFGGYTGNGSTDGAFIYTGFRPRFVMVKQTNNVGNWIIWDTARSTYNQMQDYLVPNSSSQELNNVLVSIDALSNGFKCRTADNDINGSGDTYIYMAFAENPFRNSLAR